VRISSGSSVLSTGDSLNNNKNSFMGNLLYIVAFIFIIAWLVGFLGFHAGGAFHLLLVVAIIATLLRIMQEKTAL
jgi:uncharacterized protein DUF5670